MQKKLFRWLLYALGALVVVAVALAAALPSFIDSPAVRAEIQRRISAAVGGEVAWQALAIGWLPAPHAELRAARIEIPGVARVGAEQLDVYLRLWPLLRGRPQIASLALRKPRIELAAAPEGTAAPPAPRQKPLDPVALYRSIAQPAVDALQRFAPDTTVQLVDAALEMQLPSAPPAARTIALTGLNATARSGSRHLELELETASNLWRKLRIDARLGYADLSAQARLALDELAIDKELPPASLRATLSTDAKTSIVGELEGALGSLAPALKGRLELPAGKPPSLAAELGEVDLPQIWSLLQARLPALNGLGPLEGRLSASARVVLSDAWRADIDIVKSSATFALPQLPAPVALKGGAASVDAAGLRLDKVALELLDAKTLVGGTIGFDQLQVELAASQGVAGDKLVAWGLDLGGVPKEIHAKTPVRFAARRIAWSPQAGLVVQAQLELDDAPRIGVDLALTPQRFELRRLSIKDAKSDATITALVGGGRLETGFSGLLYATSLAALRREPVPRSGRVQGDLRLKIDRARPERSVATGKLEVQDLDLSVLAGGRPVTLARADLAVEGDRLKIGASRLVVDEQVLELSGTVRRTGQGPVVEARFESPGLVVERLLPPKKPQPQPSEPAKIWPLPVTGRVDVRVGFVQLGSHKVAPLAGTLVLEPERARVDLKEAKTCGVSLPLQLEANPQGFSVAAQLAMQDEPFENAVRCLTGDTVQITGTAKLRADLKTKGRNRDEYLRNLSGTLDAELAKGRVERFALLGNIMSFLNLNVTSARDVASSSFAYRTITAKGRFADGGFLVDEGFFDSDAVRLAANGRVDLLGKNSELNVLIGLLTRVDRFAGAIPLLGYVAGGSLTAIPVTLNGDIRDPLVVPLGPRAVTDHLLGIFERALKLPGKLVPGAPPAKPAPER